MYAILYINKNIFLEDFLMFVKIISINANELNFDSY